MSDPTSHRASAGVSGGSGIAQVRLGAGRQKRFRTLRPPSLGRLGLAHNMEAVGNSTSFARPEFLVQAAREAGGSAPEDCFQQMRLDVVTSCFRALSALRQRTWTLSQEDAPMASP